MLKLTSTSAMPTRPSGPSRSPKWPTRPLYGVAIGEHLSLASDLTKYPREGGLGDAENIKKTFSYMGGL